MSSNQIVGGWNVQWWLRVIGGLSTETVQQWVSKETLLNELQGYRQHRNASGEELAEIFGDGDEWAELLDSGIIEGSSCQGVAQIRINFKRASRSEFVCMVPSCAS